MTGTKPVKQYTVRGGASVTLTDNHPVWHDGDWVPVGTLKIGDKIAVLSDWGKWESISEVRGFVEHGNNKRSNTQEAVFPVTPELGRLIGYMMTDGSNRPGQSIKFTNTRECYLQEVEQLVEGLTGVTSKRYPKGNGFDLLFTTTKAHHDNKFMDLMRVLRWDERFPTDLFRMSENVVCEAINRAWSGDGCVSFTENCKYPDIHVACKNEVHARYFQLLLMKLGIQTRLSTEWMKKSTKWFHRLCVLGSGKNVKQFFGKIGMIFGKEDQSERALAYYESRSKCQEMRKIDHYGDDDEAFHLAKIVRIDDLGERQVWDVSVPGKGWLVAQGVKAHNSGKSQTAGAKALLVALTEPDSLVLLISPTLRQSGELFRDKILRVYNGLGRPVAATQISQLSMTLANGSRIISLPGEEGTIRGYSSVRMLVIDEASRVPDGLYAAVRPMLMVSHGDLVCMTTPWGKQGWFWTEWERVKAAVAMGKRPPWHTISISGHQCPRMTARKLAEERVELGDRWFAQEYECEFVDVIDAVFSESDIVSAMAEPRPPLFGLR